MSKSDKDLESRTVAKSPLQQSSFVFFPEEEKIRDMILKDPQSATQAAKAALKGQREKQERQRLFLQSGCALCIQTGEELSALAGAFAQKLPQSVFGIGNGTDLLLPLDLLFEQVKACEDRLDRLLLDLDLFWQTDPFDPARFAFLASVLPDQTILANEADAVGKEGEQLRERAKTLCERIGDFCQTVIESFFDQAATAADLANNGVEMRFGKLSALCGELQSAAGRFARLCGENSAAVCNH